MVPQKTLSPRAWIALLSLASLWGASFVSIKIALGEVGPVTSVAHRTFWAMLVLWGVILLRGLPVPRGRRIWTGFFIMGLLNNAIPFGLMAWGQVHIESGLTSILNAATAIFGVLLAAVFFADERLTLRRGLGVILGFAGVVVAIGVEAIAQFDLRSLAQLAVLGGTISYAVAGIWARKRLTGLRPVVAATGMLTCSALIMVPLAWIVEGPIRLDLQPQTMLAIGYYAILATACAYLLYYYVLGLAGSGNLLLVTLLIAPIAILLGAVLLGETLHPQAYAGFALLAAGLIVIDGRALRWRRSIDQTVLRR